MRSALVPSRRAAARRADALPMGAHRSLAAVVAARKCTPPMTRDQPHWSLFVGSKAGACQSKVLACKRRCAFPMCMKVMR